MVYDSLQVIIQEKQSKQVHLWEIWHDEGYKIGKRGPSQQLLSVCLSVKSSIAQVLASWFRKDARRGICDCPSCSGLDAKRNGQPSSQPSFLEVLACLYSLLWVACVLLQLPLSRCLCWSLPHSERLNPPTIIAKMALKSAWKTEYIRSFQLKTPQNAIKNGAYPFSGLDITIESPFSLQKSEYIRSEIRM